MKKFGEDRAQWALGITGFLVAIPVFFDVGFIILVPIVYGLAKKTGRSLLYYGIPLLAGLAVTHSFIPPTPGPIAVANLIGADLGWVILFGFIAGVPAMMIAGPLFGKYIAKNSCFYSFLYGMERA
ncbi:Gnt-II system L-idonate transporter [Anoxybacillus sp. BCO1]|nr:Gnt-II system L-idonate transporter [Anoxybacillus sp. BCO1]